MSKVRAIKPELFTHMGLFNAEKLSQLPLRMAFIALLTCCDREGRFKWEPERLKLCTLPYDEADMSEVLGALATYGFIVHYRDEKAEYGCIPSWKHHQPVNSREVASNIPAFEPQLRIESKFSTSILER